MGPALPLLLILPLLISSQAHAQTAARDFKGFTDSVAKEHGVYPIPVLIPKGRSPERFQTSNSDPRIIVGFSKNSLPSQIDNSSSYFAKRVYFAYAKKAKLAQKIEFNPETRQFDFFVDRNYGGTGTPHFALVENRAECLSCHQSGGPIFAGPIQWNEMNEIVGGMGDGAVTGRIRSAVGKSTYEGYRIEGVAGLPLVNNVLSSEQLLLAAQICTQIGANEPDIRAWLLAKAVLKRNFSEKLNVNAAGLLISVTRSPTREKEPDPVERKILEGWPEGKSTIRSSMLPDIPLGMSYEYLRSLASKGMKTLDQVRFSSGAPSRAKQDLKVLLDELNPAVLREFVPYPPKAEALEYLRDIAFECLGFTEKDQASLSKRTDEELELALRSPAVVRALSTWPAARTVLMNALNQGLGGDCIECAKAKLAKADSLSQTLTKPNAISAAPARNDEAETTRPISTRHLQLLCSECHQESTGIRPSMPFEDETKMKAFVKGNAGALVSVIEQSYMPPSFAKAQPSDPLKKELVKWLKEQ